MDRAIAFSKRQCACALISALVVVISVCIGVTINLTNLLNDDFENVGIKTFFMFTVNSNIFVALGMMMVVPYAVDGIRKNNYHLPNWIITFLHVGTTAIALTFLISAFFLAPTKGLEPIFWGSNFFLHGVCPIFAMASFLFFISDHKISTKETLLPVVPVVIYGVIYFIMVLVVGEENGGWSDFYGFATKIPAWISIVFIPPLTFGVAFLLKVIHNATYNRRKRKEAALYKESFKDANVREIIANSARSRIKAQSVRDIVIPVRVIEIIVRDSDCSVEEGCKIYLNACLEAKENGNS